MDDLNNSNPSFLIHMGKCKGKKIISSIMNIKNKKLEVKC